MIRYASRVFAFAVVCVTCCACDNNAKQTSAAKNIQALISAMARYRTDYNSIPPIPPGLNVLAASYVGWGGHQFGPYVSDASVLIDPWGHPFVYHNSAKNPFGYDIFSCGPDGKE